MSHSEIIKQEFAALVRAAFEVTEDIGEEVERLLQDAHENPLSVDEATDLLTKVVGVIKHSAKKRGDVKTVAALEGDVEEFVDQVVAARRRVEIVESSAASRRLELLSHNGIPVTTVRPRPTFHGIEVPMKCGFVKTTDIALWDENVRLDIHLGQFENQHGRKPGSEELLEIMLGRMRLPGVSSTDEFKILDLARSIAANGVQKPPIIDIDGTLLDGNRRVAACNLILSSSEFSQAEKRRAETIFVWQLTEHATDTERNAVVVALNFEEEFKKPWPEYVKARKVYDEWEEMLALEHRPPKGRQGEMRRELSRKFALGPDASVVNRYIKMIELAIEFEDHHINQRGADEFEVKHQSSKYFQYFDELQRGIRPGGVAHAIGSDDAYRELVFDLLFQDKFASWTQIRDLKHAAYNDEVRAQMIRARDEEDLDNAQDILDKALRVSRLTQEENRTVGANTRIESFVKWFTGLPIGTFTTEIQPESYQRLVEALRFAEQVAEIVHPEEMQT